MLKKVIAAVSVLVMASGLSAQVWISEVLMNAPNGSDDNREFFEIQGSAHFNLNGWYFLSIDGDGAASGGVDQVISLSGLSTGANGLLLVQDPNIVLLPAPDPLTNISIVAFTPDIENGSNTFVLGYGTPPNLGDDLDLNDDGVLDAPISGFTVVDAVSHAENDGVSNYEFADDFGFPGGLLGTRAGFNADAFYRVLNSAGTAPAGWALGDVLGTDPGPFTFDALRNERFDTFGYPNASLVPLSPGSLNISAIVSGFTFSGSVTLSDYVGAVTAPSLTIEVYDNANALVQTFTGNLDGSGNYSFASTLGAGTYTLKAKASHWLKKNSVRVIDGSSNQVVNFVLTNGDCDGDNEVGVGDYALLSFAYNSQLGDPTYVADADLNGDEAVDIADYSVLSANYGLFGED